jgi:hypothetical protein
LFACSRHDGAPYFDCLMDIVMFPKSRRGFGYSKQTIF